MGKWHRGSVAVDGRTLLDLAFDWKEQFEAKGMDRKMPERHYVDVDLTPLLDEVFGAGAKLTSQPVWKYGNNTLMLETEGDFDTGVTGPDREVQVTLRVRRRSSTPK